MNLSSVLDLIKAFPNEQTCIDHLEILRWNGNVVSPFEASSKVYNCNGNKYKWQQKFPDTFYFEIFRLNNWDYTVNGIKKRPEVISTWTNELIYKQLPKRVLNEIKEKTPKSEAGNYTARFFQSLTPDIGHPVLTAQIYKVIGIISSCHTWTDFKMRFNIMVDRTNGQTKLNFEDIEN